MVEVGPLSIFQNTRKRGKGKKGIPIGSPFATVQNTRSGQVKSSSRLQEKQYSGGLVRLGRWERGQGRGKCQTIYAHNSERKRGKRGVEPRCLEL